ncbi:MAG: adenosine deaminase [Anaerolineales bacterium]|nr:adenosine deaminase [Anaerolineales bacterium]
MAKLQTFIKKMPKAELHVHLEGSVLPATLLKLARRHQIALPADTVEGLREWYTFRDFDHFIEIYMVISSCLRTAEDIELITREFLQEQARQNILYTEATFTPYNQYMNCQLDFQPQMEAVNRARRWGYQELGVQMNVIMDIPRIIPPDQGDRVAGWALEWFGGGLAALGLGGPEVDNPPEKYRRAFNRVRQAGIPCVLHAGETVGPSSIWSALKVAESRRIGHGVRAVEDPALVEHLRAAQTPLEVCPTSNLCLGVYPSMEAHSLPVLMESGLFITLNSDDPPMFNTTLTEEYLRCQRAFGWEQEVIQGLVMNAVEAALLPEEEKAGLRKKFLKQFAAL